MFSHIAYILVCILLATSIPAHAIADVANGLVVVGAVGIWRYSWAMTNFVRAFYFRHYAYPRQKARAQKLFQAQQVHGHAYFLTTSYKIEPDVTRRVYRSIFEAASKAEGGATIVASVVEGSDVRLIRGVFSAMPYDMGSVRLLIDQIPGTGKRDALARSLRLIARQAPTRQDIVIFVDGDSCVPIDIVAQTAPTFTDPTVGALTTDERVEIKDNPLFASWFDLRFTQRQMMMCSMGLSGRVLTLTGRMSVFRADLVTRGDFIDLVQNDFIDHWRLGRVNFLTGDDKSTWFWLLKNGYKMAYLPDVASLSMESQPTPRFVESAVTLMVRWFGNMLRTNGRALALSPRDIGYFTWWSILDQRLGIWTTLAGPISVIASAIFVEPLVLVAYAAWVMFTRYVFCMILSRFRGGYFPIIYPFLLYFGQIMGAAVKSYVLFRLDRQRWTRQSTATSQPGSGGLSLAGRIGTWGSAYNHALALGWLTFGVLLMSGVI